MKITAVVGLEDSRDFKMWWIRGRILFVVLFFGTIMSIVSVIFSTNVYYQNFFTPTDLLCTHTAKRVSNFTIGWLLLLGILLCTFYLLV